MTDTYDLRPEPVSWTPPSGPDVALLTKTLELITEHAQRPEVTGETVVAGWTQDTWLSRPPSEDEGVTVAVAEWDCGTAACMAGHVVVGDGVPVIWDSDTVDDSRAYADYVVTAHLDEPTRAALTRDPDQMTPDRTEQVRTLSGVADLASVETYARVRLGLTVEQAQRLFRATNGLWTLWAAASEFTDGAVQIPASVLPTPTDLWSSQGYDLMQRHGYAVNKMRIAHCDIKGEDRFTIIRVDES